MWAASPRSRTSVPTASSCWAAEDSKFSGRAASPNSPCPRAESPAESPSSGAPSGCCTASLARGRGTDANGSPWSTNGCFALVFQIKFPCSKPLRGGSSGQGSPSQHALNPQTSFNPGVGTSKATNGCGASAESGSGLPAERWRPRPRRVGSCARGMFQWGSADPTSCFACCGTEPPAPSAKSCATASTKASGLTLEWRAASPFRGCLQAGIR